MKNFLLEKIVLLLLFLACSPCGVLSKTIVIDKPIDLKGRRIVFSKGDELKFVGNGAFKNGILQGCNNSISAPKHCIFYNVSVEGIWSNSKVFSQWVGLERGNHDNLFKFRVLSNLCRGDTYTHLFIQEGVFNTSTELGSAPITLPSNTYLHNLATITLLPSSHVKGAIVIIEQSCNVTIDGGCLIGDVRTHIGKNGEWLHGIACKGAANITIKNLIIKENWGDGIDLIESFGSNHKASIICRNIVIKNVKCLYNRRQGISVEAASNVNVYDSEFAYTGKIKATRPSAGLDIEPWEKGDKIRKICFDRCYFHDNVGHDIESIPNWLHDNNYFVNPNEISFKRCKIGFLNLWYNNGALIENCIITDTLRIGVSDNIVVKESQMGYYQECRGVEQVSFRKCSIKDQSLTLRMKRILSFFNNYIQ